MKIKHIGIIGGGQLARMLAMSALRLGCKVSILDPQENCPAKELATNYFCAPYNDIEALKALSIECDVITYEFENVSVEALSELSCEVYPPMYALQISQDRYLEKSFFASLSIKTTEWMIIDSLDDLPASLRKLGGEAILKTRRMGYDGHGQCRLNINNLDSVDNLCKSFDGVPCILEALVPFEREISVIAARNNDNEVKVFDVVENTHDKGILRQSTVPANISAEISEKAKQKTAKILSSLDYVGVLAVEFFVLPDGELLANEFAPRVHNSGHWTEAACYISQFEQHIRAVIGLPLVDTYRHSDCVMNNILGFEIESIDDILKENNVVVNLYAKEEIKEKRKMGHYTRLSKRIA